MFCCMGAVQTIYAIYNHVRVCRTWNRCVWLCRNSGTGKPAGRVPSQDVNFSVASGALVSVSPSLSLTCYCSPGLLRDKDEVGTPLDQLLQKGGCLRPLKGCVGLACIGFYLRCRRCAM